MFAQQSWRALVQNTEQAGRPVLTAEDAVEYACPLLLAGDEAGHEQFCERATTGIDSSANAASYLALAPSLAH